MADSPYTVDGSGYVTDIAFDTYGGVYSWEGPKNSHVFESNSGGEEGANKHFVHRGLVKVFSSDPSDDTAIEELLTANVGVIVQDNNDEFFIYGGKAGMEVLPDGITKSTQAKTGDTSFNIQMEGVEKELPLRFLDTDFATTLAKIVGYEL